MYSGIRVLAGSLASISAAGRLCEVSVCVLLSLDYRMYFYTEITYILYVTSVFEFPRFPIFLSHEAAICLCLCTCI